MKISICLCTYNGEKYLKEQLQSIVNQTMLPDEIVVCDDCSTDNTIAILKDFVSNNPLIEWRIFVNEHNLGWKANFRNCIERASGDYIFLCDQDDVWKSDKIQVMTEAMARDDKIELLMSKFHTVYEKDAIDHNRECKCKNTGKVSKYREICKLTACFYPGCGWVFKSKLKPLFFKVWESCLPHDHVLCAIAQLRESAYMIDYESIDFRRHECNASSKYPIKKISAKSKTFEYKYLFELLTLCNNLSLLAKDGEIVNMLILKKQIDWLNYRIAYYQKPRLYKFIWLFFSLKYYRSFKNYLKDINALLFKS